VQFKTKTVCVGMVALVLIALGTMEAVAAPNAAAPQVATSSPPVEARRARLGIGVDAGLPDGAVVTMVLQPASWLRLAAGGGTNSMSLGVRGGVTAVPLGAGPSLTIEGGTYRFGETNAGARGLLKLPGVLDAQSTLLGYNYLNTHVGLDFGRRSATFFFHAGLSFVHGRLRGVAAMLAERGDGDTTVEVTNDPTFSAVMPSLKTGLILYLP